ncbi:hypothetical protein W911_05965 [Hyphomicrobium nitrativorans NL23]|uniref:Uncharacterized protein n=1 Tax=Hyphomicrobium nitrativorans NL23 TaxID=1029756 RepID=V5SHI7_9HYPH|nr:hypothetical protein [Hyphomicrobium nitrativorans]AHB50008.1 hypothetical protein W911_05965 [Hyphomicrobium nitrativorans NL23]
MSTYENRTLAVLINAIDQRLLSASHYSAEAHEAIKHERRNEAIGALLLIEQDLETALQLHRATIALHRTMKGGAV